MTDIYLQHQFTSFGNPRLPNALEASQGMLNLASSTCVLVVFLGPSKLIYALIAPSI